MAKAALHHHSKLTYPDGAIREMILWRLPTRTPAVRSLCPPMYFVALCIEIDAP